MAGDKLKTLIIGLSLCLLSTWGHSAEIRSWSGLTKAVADTTFLRLDGGNVPTANYTGWTTAIETSSYFRAGAGFTTESYQQAGIECSVGHGDFWGTQYPSMLLRTGQVGDTDGYLGFAAGLLGVDPWIQWTTTKALRLGVGGAAGNMESFDHVMSIDTAGLHIVADDQVISWGNAGVTDSYARWGGVNLEFYSSGSYDWQTKNFINVGNITGTDVDISAGTGDWATTGNVDIGGTGDGKLYIAEGTRTMQVLPSTYLINATCGDASAYGIYISRTNGAIVLFDGSSAIAQFFGPTGQVYMHDGTYALHVTSGQTRLGGAVTLGSTLTDGTLTLTNGSFTGVGNITGSDVDISAGTGTYTSSGTLGAGAITCTSLDATAGLITTTGNTSNTADDAKHLWGVAGDLEQYWTGSGGVIDPRITSVSSGLKIGIGLGTTAAEIFEVTGHLNFDQVTGPTATMGNTWDAGLSETGSGSSFAAGEYHYSIRFVCNDGKSVGIVSSANYPDITISVGSDITHTDIPISPDPRVTSREIFRTEADESYHLAQLVHTLNDNTTTTWVDDGSIVGSGGIAYRLPNTTAGKIKVNDVDAMFVDKWTTSFGLQALNSLAGGADNIGLGYQALLDCTTGSTNIAIGTGALRDILASDNNIGIGYAALRDNTSGTGNVGIGYASLFMNSSGTANYNVGIGKDTLYQLEPGKDRNTAVGYRAGYRFSGEDNVFLGYYAGRCATRQVGGDDNILIGSMTGDNIGAGANRNIIIGANLDLSAVDVDGELNIGGIIRGDMDTGGYTAFTNAFTGTAQSTRLFTLDGDGTDNNTLSIYGVGTLADQTNSEALHIAFLEDSDTFEMFTSASGTGTDRDLYIYTNVVGQSYSQIGVIADGTTRIGNAAGANHINFATNGDQSFVGDSGFYPRRITQSAIPASGTGATQIDTGEMVLWEDSDDGKVYFVYNDATSGVKSVELI